MEICKMKKRKFLRSNITNKHEKSLIYTSSNTKKLKEILKESDEHTLVIWDVDGVLLIGRDRIFHSENIHSGLNYKYVDHIKNKYNLTSEQENSFISRILLQRRVFLIDEAILNIINELKSKDIRTIALTQFSVGPFGDIKRIEDWRVEELNELGIKFDSSFKGLAQIDLDKLPKFNSSHPLYKHGVLFCNRSDKGKVLGAFLDITYSKIQWRPNKIIFIDDKIESLKVVRNELTQRNIDFIGLHYTAALDFPYTVDDRIVKFQFEYAKQKDEWLDDKRALEKIEDIIMNK